MMVVSILSTYVCAALLVTTVTVVTIVTTMVMAWSEDFYVF